MIGELLLRLNSLLSRHKLSFFIGLLLITGMLGWGISRLRITESIFATLPKGKTFEEFNRLVENKNFINQIVFSLEYTDNTGTYDAAELAQNFADSLNKACKGLIINIQAIRPDVQQDVYNYTYDHFPQLIDSSYYAVLSPRLSADSINRSVSAVKKQLIAPGGTFFKQFILNDPLGVTGPYFRRLNAVSNAGGISVADGVMFSGDNKKILVTAITAYNSGNSEKDVALFNRVEAFKTKWDRQFPVHKLSYFGTFEISARNAIQVKQDSLKTMLIAITAILLLLISYYRKVLTPLFLILPGLFGGLFALGITGFFRPGVSGISLATGAVVFGILLDYSFHFFTHLRHTGSIQSAIKEVSSPLLTGSFTTVMAFTALHFTNSTVLQDFGFFASLSLLGAAVFTLTGLPVILESVGIDFTQSLKEPVFFRLPRWSGRLRTPVVAIIILLTGIFLYYAQFTTFDSSFENLSIQNDDLKKRENELTGLNPSKEKRIYVFATSTTNDRAQASNYQVFQKLSKLKEQEKITSFISSGTFLVPSDIREERSRRWKEYWTPEKKSQVFSDLNKASAQNGFSIHSFDSFKRLVAFPANHTDKNELLIDLGFDNLVDIKAGKVTYITPVIVPLPQLENVKADLRAVPGTEIFDRGELAASLLTMVKDDFNYILLISASVVFLTLLIVYGRLELALLTFLPMVMSWIWILGIAALVGIKFNFVNVVVTTFIFGLGDDFSIFVTDGLLSKYKDGKDNLKSYRSAIILSGLTTIIGTGALIFAKHPAIHSIALISVLGIVCILLISFVFQPLIFNLFVQNRIARKKAPVTLLPFLISISSFTYFLSGCLFLHSKLVTILLLPVSRKRKREMINRSLSFYAKTVIYSGPHVRKNFSGLENLPTDKPVIFIANHSSFLDILLAIMMSPKIVLMVKGWVYNSPFFGPIIRFAGYIYTEDGPEENLRKVKQLVADGYSLLIFPEGTRSYDGEIGRFHKGAFHLAQELGLDIQPILIHGASEVLPKNDFLISSGGLNVRVLPRISITDGSWGIQLRDITKNISAHFKAEYARYRDEMETTTYLQHRIFTNYVFKGPVLEWYFKIKWKLEAKNYTFYNEQIAGRKHILDVGCGYGYLSFFLHYKNPDRVIQGVDYDEEKILTARNSYHKTENLLFFYQDIMTYEMSHQDVIFLNDILHYLSEEKQFTLLNRCVEALGNGGILFIRDGITDFSEQHENTKLTEKLSTGLFSFNKKQDEFHFFHSDTIRHFAAKHGLDYEMRRHSANTSNVLFILKKNGPAILSSIG
ncbi:Carboxy-S-adenosyl-L-methionine synthase [Dyadobacter sp. CECT 9275]|uniref:Carboxy-S-adenosyl-L-methionine synthase n=1 Tax=Dyadobacter helix TaxID=2822344 RepID=A0A916J936_9BACT|nr:1-acyl-sn-glycerol-3-phosphate acyltransferase [Dyadobacter sp. CECT 9275]CAG4995018.1 Carboxy-S-adenosyl-L-methionine synthase [Dyadobacter sp. CECT 9275]